MCMYVWPRLLCNFVMTAGPIQNILKHRLMLHAPANQRSSLNLSGCLTLLCSFNNWFNLQPLSLPLSQIREGRRNRGEKQREWQESERGHRNGVNKTWRGRNRERWMETRRGASEREAVREEELCRVERGMERMWAKLSMRLNWCVSCWSTYLKSVRHPTNSAHTVAYMHSAWCTHGQTTNRHSTSVACSS